MKNLRFYRNILIVAVALTAFQFVSRGEVTWHLNLYHWVTGSVSDYATRPEAGWKKASNKLENAGATKEGRPTPDFDLSGRVVRIADGDTISILDRDKNQHKIRLFGIDTPERDQPHGQAAQRALSALLSGETVGVVRVETDSYGRTVGTVYLNNENINLHMVAAGHGWWYRYYAPHERHLAKAEEQAREDGLGLWAASSPVPPWDWRRSKR